MTAAKGTRAGTPDSEASSASPGDDPGVGDVSVVICAYTLDRWELLSKSIDSVLDQTLRPRELILSIDHNPDLFKRCLEHWGELGAGRGVPIQVVENRYDGHLGSARTTAAELATGRYIAFLDDDASAEPDWLEQMLAPFEDTAVIAVGGRPLPAYSKPRPSWFPLEYDWVFGCAYLGLPETTAPIQHVIGAAMAVRRDDLVAIGYFHSDNHDDMDMCHRLVHHSPTSVIMFQPSAVVNHFVHENRLTWGYFWRRCFFVNRGKVGAFRQMGGARNLEAERRFARRALNDGLARGGREALGGDLSGLGRSFALCAGLVMAGIGYLVGTFEWKLDRFGIVLPGRGRH